jgi:hypothetical protein
MITESDWFNLAMTLWPYWVAIMFAVATVLILSAYVPWRRHAHHNNALIPFRDDELS